MSTRARTCRQIKLVIPVKAGISTPAGEVPAGAGTTDKGRWEASTFNLTTAIKLSQTDIERWIGLLLAAGQAPIVSIRNLRVPLGTVTSTVSPTDLSSRAWPTGETVEILPDFTSASRLSTKV